MFTSKKKYAKPNRLLKEKFLEDLKYLKTFQIKTISPGVIF